MSFSPAIFIVRHNKFDFCDYFVGISGLVAGIFDLVNVFFLRPSHSECLIIIW